MSTRLTLPLGAVPLRAGDVQDQFRVVDPVGYCGVLPIAVIREGSPNAGLTVVLTHYEKRP